MNAATAAYWAGTGGQRAKFPARASTASTRSAGSRVQPSRQPVIPQNLENDDTTTASRLCCHAQLISTPARLMPW